MDPIVIIAISVGAALLLAFCAYIFLIAPGAKRGINDFSGVKFAHRGLHGEGKAENSISAFRAAVEAGYGIELDVRLSGDGVPVVFHDDTLERVCSDPRRVIDLSAEELSKMKLLATDDTVPTFAEVLALVDGRVPLLVEIKESAGDSSVTAATVKMLKEYKGRYLVESFNPFSVKNAGAALKSIPCGILATASYSGAEAAHGMRNFLLTNLLTNVICRPSFIAYDVKSASKGVLRLLGFLFGAVRIAWTVRSAEEEELAGKYGFDGIIFENYLPRI